MADFENKLGNIAVGDDNIAVWTLQMEGRANKINETFINGMVQGVDWLEARDGLAGVILATGHKDFCVGADLDFVYRERDPQLVFDGTKLLNTTFRRLEQLRVPVVAALTGSALGGGYEVALATHHRIALNSGRIQLGLPEVALGVIPGGGGTQRLPRLVGLQAALEVIAQATPVRAPKAKAKGLVDALAETPEELMAAARAWIAANPRAKQPWDSGAKLPPPRPGSLDFANLIAAGGAMLYKKTAGAFPAAEAAVSVVQDGLRLDFDRALEVESRAFAKLVVSDQAKDMIRTFFFHRTAAMKQEGLPQVADPGFAKVTILGAGMMGAGLAFITAKAGYTVVLKDISDEALERGMAHIDKQIGKLRHLGADAQAELRARITPTTELEPIRGSDLVIEAVFENLELKHRVTKEVLPLLSDNAVFASNTSAIPITDLAKASDHPDRFIGLHFFSPVEKMPLLEIIRGADTSDDTLARALAYNRAIKKLPIVVNDGYGFYTSRTFSAYILESARLVAEGHDPATIEWAARVAGMVVSPLQVFDEVSLELGRKAMAQAAKYKGIEVQEDAGTRLMLKMVEQADRKGKAHGAGFYDYKDGRRRGLWSGLRELAEGTPEQTGVEYIGRRLILAQVAEVGRSIDDGILNSWRDAEVGAIFGIGFAPNTGGPLAWVDRQGVANVVAELDALEAQFGERYRAADVFRKMAAGGETFFEMV